MTSISRGFIVYPTYKVVDGKAFIHLYGRLDDGKSFLALIERKAYFYIKEKDKEKAEKLFPLEIDESSKDFRNFDDEPVIKILLSNPKDVPDARKILQDQGIICYESDILFVYRYMIDHNLKGTIEIHGKGFSCKEHNSMYSTNYNVDIVYLNPEIKPCDYFPKLKVIAIDIETDMKAEKLYCVSIYSENYKKVLIAKKGFYHNAESFETEKEVLVRFSEIIKELDPDVISGWHLIDFDLQVLRELYRKYNLPTAFGRDDSSMFVKLSDSFYQDSVAKIEGRIVLDGIHALKTSFIRLQDYKLSTAAKHFVGEGKLIDDEDRKDEIERYFNENPQKLIDYNLKDSELVIRILEKSNVLNLTIARSKLTRMQLDRVKASIASLDSLYLEKIQKLKIVAPTAFTADKEESIKGGFVRDSLPGVYDNILVFDFKSLYPSIIRTFNIDPYSFVSESKAKLMDEKEKKKLVKAPNGAYFRNNDGVLPSIIQELWGQRDKAKKEKDELKSYAIKILMNSFYGVLANPTCRFFSTEMANAITHFGQFLIKLTAEEMSKKGYLVIYGDTDSIFIDIKEKDYQEALKKGEDIAKIINEFFKHYIKENYNRDSKMEIEFEKVYKKFLMPRIRGSEVGAKKRYVGILEEDGKDDLDFVGMEVVRSDWTDIAKKFQTELVMKVFKGEKFAVYVRDFVNDLKKGKYDELLVYRKQIRKSVDEYTKTTPPHIQAARKIGRNDTGVIYYIMTTDGPEEKSHLKHKPDYEHYIEKQIKPIADAILGFYNHNFDEIVKNHKQNSLLDY